MRDPPAGLSFRLIFTVAVLSSTGAEPIWRQSLGSADDLCRRRRRDYYINYRLTLPTHLTPGPYLLRLTQTDEVAGHSTSRTLPFTIQP